MSVVAPPQIIGGVEVLSCCSRTSVARVLTSRDHRIEFVMVQFPTSPKDSSADFDHHVVLCPTRSAARVLSEPPARAARRWPAVPQARVTRRAQGRVVVLEVAGRLGDVVQDVDRAIQLALADKPRGVVCDLSAVLEGVEPDAIGVLAKAGRHVRDWPAIPIAVACPDPRVREALRVLHLGGHLIVTESMLPAISAVLATPIPDVDCLRLTPHPTAPRASRNLIARALLDWGLGPLVPAASLVVSELVTNSTIHAGTDIELSVAWSLGLLRVTVRDNSPDLPRRLYPQLDDVHGRGLSVVTALSRAFGVLPTAEGGKVVWAVLNAARPRPPTSNGMHNPKHGHETQLGSAHPKSRRELPTFSHPLPTPQPATG
jgi:hypothetical protein